MKFIYICIVLTLLFSCNGDINTESLGSNTEIEFKTSELNLDEGYDVNVISGDTIKPFLHKSGDTIITGKWQPNNSVITYLDSVVPAPIVTVKHPEELVKAYKNEFEIANNELSTVELHGDIEVTSLSENLEKETLNYVKNSVGDSIITGREIFPSGVKVKAKFTRSITAGLFRSNDRAINSLEFLDIEQGLSASNIYCMIEDRKGNMWFGTQGGGLSVYNGVSFNHFTKKEGLCGNNILSLLEDKDGNIWIGTQGSGLCMYDGQYFTHYSNENGLINNFVMSIIQSQDGNIWFGTYGGGLSVFNGESFTHYTKNEGVISNVIMTVMQDSDQNIWMGSKSGVSKFDGEKFTHFKKENGLSNNLVYSIIEDNNSDLWFGTYGGGLIKFDGTIFTNYTEKNGLCSNYIWSVLKDSDGDIWIGSFDSGISQLRGDKFINYSTDQGLTHNYVRKVFEDKSGKIWFGTYGGGLNRLTKGSFQHFTNGQLFHQYISCVTEDKNGNIWFGTKSNGLLKFDGENFSNYTQENGLSRDKIISLLCDKSGNIWIGTRGGGADKYDGQTITNYNRSQGLTGAVVLSILEDENGDLWFGTKHGCSKFNGTTMTTYTSKNDLPSNQVQTFLADKEGNIWVAALGAATKFKNNEHIHYTTKQGLPSNSIRVMFEDQYGGIWFGTTNSGACRLKGGQFTYYTEDTKLNSNKIKSISEDKKGNIWISTSKGINVITAYQRNEQDTVPIIYSFNKNDGLLSLNFNLSSHIIDSKNRAWWGGMKSLTMFDLDNFIISKHAPKVDLTRIDINENFIDFNSPSEHTILDSVYYKNVESFNNYPANLELPHNLNHLTFYFVGLDWKASHKVKYSHFMEGLEDNWSEPNSDNKVDYRNLPYGSFKFKLRAVGENGVWSNTIEYDVIILAPWYHTLWARTLYVLLGLLIIFGVIKNRTVKLKKRQAELENEVENATREIIQQKEIVEEAHKEITDSIIYAERIQRSFLATEDLLNNNLGEHFIYFNPKEAVSGDFYWAGILNNGNFALSCADSTGHGVPGAIMSILNISSIEKAVENKATKPADIFNQARQLIIDRLKKDGSLKGGKDGMDGCLISFNTERTVMQYVAANNPIWIIRTGELIDIKAEKMPVGKHDHDHIPFKGGEYELQKGDLIYTLTDGYQDQFGGEKGKKFKVKPFKRLLLDISSLSMPDQYQKISEAFDSWKGDLEQIDDVCIIGIKI